jgi:hypothetical protein
MKYDQQIYIVIALTINETKRDILKGVQLVVWNKSIQTARTFKEN